jgi:hypothetical protein
MAMRTFSPFGFSGSCLAAAVFDFDSVELVEDLPLSLWSDFSFVDLLAEDSLLADDSDFSFESDFSFAFFESVSASLSFVSEFSFFSLAAVGLASAANAAGRATRQALRARMLATNRTR